MDRIIKHLKNSRHVLLSTHVNPDGDGLGSMIALGLVLDAMGRQVTLYNESSIPAVFSFLPGVDRIVSKIKDFCDYDTAGILDCSDLGRVGESASEIEQIPTVINIDHHITNSNFGNMQLIMPDACASAEIVYRLIRRMGAQIDKNIAISIYTGILTDTGSFRFANTNRAAFEICEEMIQVGVEPYMVAQKVYGAYSLGRIKLLNLALNSIEISANRKLSMMTLTQKMLDETHTRPEDIDGLIPYAMGIADIRVAVLVRERHDSNRMFAQRKRYHVSLPGKDWYFPGDEGELLRKNRYDVSLRSDGTVDVAEIAARFGGGGHSRAAGFSIETTLADLKKQLFELSERF